jgi:hypothetical protein
MMHHKFREIERSFKVRMKAEHTLVDKWPLMLKLLPQDDGAKLEFERLMASSHTGCERYVEWKRIE